MEYWRSLAWSRQRADYELAAGAALLAGSRSTASNQLTIPHPIVRWYGVCALALVIGASQRLDEVDRAACRAAGVTVHHRSSGGKAVLLETDMLMQDIVIPVQHRLYSGDVTESYRWLGEVWVAALELLGLPARLLHVAEARADTQSLDALTNRACFGGRSPYEVLLNERKVVGFSQVRRRNGILLQVGIYMSWSPQRLPELLALSPVERSLLTTRLSERVTALLENTPLHGQPITNQTVTTAFAAALHQLQAGRFIEDSWSIEEQAAHKQVIAHYAPLSLSNEVI